MMDTFLKYSYLMKLTRFLSKMTMRHNCGTWLQGLRDGEWCISKETHVNLSKSSNLKEIIPKCAEYNAS